MGIAWVLQVLSLVSLNKIQEKLVVCAITGPESLFLFGSDIKNKKNTIMMHIMLKQLI